MSRALGADAERRVARHLEAQGYHIVDRNWTCRGGELDLVCLDGDTLVFVEVRARKDARHGAPGETVDWRKRQRLARAAQTYLHLHRAEERPCRFDVVALEGEQLAHYPNAFEIDG